MSVKLPLAIIQLETPPQPVSREVGEQRQWFVEALALREGEYVVVQPHLGEPLPDPATISAAVLSGSWAMVTDHAEWSERTAAWIRVAVQARLPLLGVCYGHQLMAYALGGEVGDNPNGWERGLQQLHRDDACGQDPLLAALPGSFSAWLSHRQSVLTPPPGAQVLAASELEPCQILRYTPHALSVQFHPEFTGRIMTACLQNSLPASEVVSLMQHQQEARWPLQLMREFLLSEQPQALRA
ncbi:glutamine amidotransferase [Erwinia sp. B116]|uniref:glutamine amidotransferase n=1 Tax=Erwinia sp. B116 TaxID=1561024 RepID=UPI000C77D659|nr:glutamine amidotransferase [Erwinia sp. B116]PLV53680.1 glutamine amidotransferase [Erwinia sp. B116]